MDILTLLSLLPIICGKYQEVELIRRLTSHFNFDHHFFLLDSSEDINRYVDTKGLTPRSLFVVTNEGNDTELEIVREIDSKNSFLIVVTAIPKFEHNFTLLRRIKKFNGFRST